MRQDKQWPNTGKLLKRNKASCYINSSKWITTKSQHVLPWRGLHTSIHHCCWLLIRRSQHLNPAHWTAAITSTHGDRSFTRGKSVPNQNAETYTVHRPSTVATNQLHQLLLDGCCTPVCLWHPENRLGTQERNGTDADIPINHLVTIRYIFLILSIVSSHNYFHSNTCSSSAVQ